MMEKHAVVIVTYNRRELLAACLEAVESQLRPYDHVVVVDNASTDGTRDFLKAYAGKPGYTVLLEKRNIGGAGGFAHGLREAVRLKMDWITLIDDDSILREDYLKEICKGIQRTGGRYVAYAGIPLTQGIRPGHRRRVQGTVVQREVPVPLSEYKKEFFTCDIASFCGLVVSREAAEKVGLPRKDFFIWFDDTEYCLRLSKLTPILNWNGAVIDHRAEVGAPEDAAGWKDYYGIRNRILVTKEYYTAATLAVVVGKKIAKALLTSGRLLLQGRTGDARNQVQLYCDAVVDGIQNRTGYCRQYGPTKC